MSVHEWDGRIEIPINRSGGSYGVSEVTYDYTTIDALPSKDFIVHGNKVTFQPGDVQKKIAVTIIDDTISEFQEKFRINLRSVTGGASFGAIKTLTVTIETSDNPNGLFGVYNVSRNVFLPNPPKDIVLSFPLSRIGGALGDILVKWQVLRLTPSRSAVTEDIRPDGGTLFFPKGDSGPHRMNISVLAYPGKQEVQEMFRLNIYSINGGAALDQSANNITITVGKKGYPNGLFIFTGTVSPSSTVLEPASGVNTVTIPIRRTEGLEGIVKLTWSVQSTSGQIDKDITLGSNPLVFQSGQSSASIKINVTADSESEIDEVYRVFLVSVNNNADIGSPSNISFTISANDNPHGVFKLLTSETKFLLDEVNLTRSLRFGVERTGGKISDVRIELSVKYSEDGSGVIHSFVIGNGQVKTTSVMLIPEAKFLIWNGSYIVQLASVNAISGSSMPPKISTENKQAVIVIPELAANGIVEFNDSHSSIFLEPDGSAKAFITRKGLFGTVSVSWVSGYPKISSASGLSTGTITPSSGSVQLIHGQQAASFQVKALIPGQLSRSLLYAVSLSSNLVPPKPQRGWPILGASTGSVIEPHGVVEVSPNSRVMSVQEGKQASIVLRRLYSTIGVIRVNYTTVKATGSNSATTGSDFTFVKGSLEFLQGQYEKTALIDIPEDKGSRLPERDEVFYVDLTSTNISGARMTDRSPRLSGQSRAVITIKDNDDPYGVMGFRKADSVITITEGTTIKVKVQRLGGTFSKASVRVRSLGGGEIWQAQVLDALANDAAIKRTLQGRSHGAQVTTDYVAVNQVIEFPEENTIPQAGQEQEITVTILQDTLAEPPESFILFLSNVTGGARIAKADDLVMAFVTVTISGNGLWNGQVGFTNKQGQLNEDASGKASFSVERVGEKSQGIQVGWTVDRSREGTKRLLVTSGTLNFTSSQESATINLELKKDELPQFATWFWLNISSVSAGAQLIRERSAINVTILDSDFPAGRIGFDGNSRYPIVNLGDTRHQLVVRRYNGTLSDVTVKYQTVAIPGVVTEGGVSLVPAVASADFTIASETLTFPKGRTEAYIDLQLTPLTASKGSYPKVFNVSLVQPTNGARLFSPYTSARVIISDKSQTSQFLRLYSDAQTVPLSDKEIENILSQLLALVSRPPLSTNDQNLAMSSIRAITKYKGSQMPGKRALTTPSQQSLLEIFNSLLQTSRSDTRSVSAWAKLLEETVYHFLNDKGCPSSFKRSLSNFGVDVERNNGSKLNGKRFLSNNERDFLRYPVNLFPTVGVTACTDMHFIDYANRQWFRTASSNDILNNKIVSSAVKDKPALSFKVVYRIHAPKTRVTPTGVSCAIWKYPTFGSSGSWETQNCKVKGETDSYVECECRHLSEYAVLAKSDDRTGYALYFYVACFVVVGACFLALIAHHICALETTFSANLLMHVFFAVMVSNALYAVGAYVSPSLITKTTECAIIGIVIHYFFLAQFTWMFSQACNLWCILVMNDEHTYRKLILFFLLGWGLPVLIIVVYIFLTVAIWSWNFVTMYGDVHKNGDMCFMANSYAAFGSVMIPVLLLVMGVIGVFVQAYQVTPQWRCYDDIYRERYNIKEVRHLMVLFTLLTLTWLFAALHLTYGYLWMIITFTALNFITGLYIFVVYALLRNQMRYVYKRKYPVRTLPPMITTENYTGYTPPPRAMSPLSRKLTESQQRLDLNEWEDVDLGRLSPIQNLPTVSRTEDYSPYTMDTFQDKGKINETFEDDLESQDLDDLIFALKTGGQLSPPDGEDQMEDDASIPPLSSEHYEMRRIEIADTHL